MTVFPPRAVLAEDNGLIRMEAADMLRDLGFDVLEAEHADAAIRHLEANDGIVLLYTDVRMLGGTRNGLELANDVARRWPSVRIVICSGCLPPASCKVPQQAHFMSKPSSTRIVRQALKEMCVVH